MLRKAVPFFSLGDYMELDVDEVHQRLNMKNEGQVFFAIMFQTLTDSGNPLYNYIAMINLAY